MRSLIVEIQFGLVTSTNTK